MYGVCVYYHYILRTAAETMRELQKELEAGKRVLTRSLEKKNELKAENQRQAK